MFKKSDLNLKLDTHSPIFTPGETISGNVVLRPTKDTTLVAIRITLSGVCRTYANESEANTFPTTRNGECGFSEDRRLVGGESVKFLQVSTTIPITQAVYPPGSHSFPFSLAIPLNCTTETEALRADWASTPLPSTFEGVSQNGTIKYVIKVAASIKGVLASQSIYRDISMASTVSCNPTPNLLPRRKIVEQAMDVKFYDYPNESTFQWAQRLIGMDTSTMSRTFLVQLVHSAAGLPSWDVPLKNVASLRVFKIDDEEDKKGLEYAVHNVRSRIVYTIVPVTSGINRDFSSVIKIHDTGALQQPLTFTETSDGKKVCDISQYLSPLGAESSLADLHAPFVTIRVPSLSVTATLQVDVGLVPTSGCPLRPKYARLESIVTFYNSQTGQLPPSVEIASTDDSLCPPPLYEALEEAPKYEPKAHR